MWERMMFCQNWIIARPTARHQPLGLRGCRGGGGPSEALEPGMHGAPGALPSITPQLPLDLQQPEGSLQRAGLLSHHSDLTALRFLLPPNQSVLHRVLTPWDWSHWPSVNSVFTPRQAQWGWEAALNGAEVTAPQHPCSQGRAGRPFRGWLHEVKPSFSLVAVHFLNCVQLFVTPWTVACQAPLSMGFSRQEYWNGYPLPSPGDLPDPGFEPLSPASLLYWLAGGFFFFFNHWTTREAPSKIKM